MMAWKAKVSCDDNNATLNKILAAKSPSEAKKLGRSIPHINWSVWNEAKVNVVIQGNIHKFSQHSDLAQFLRESGDKILVEASPNDNIWGIGMGRDNPNAQNPARWGKGDNLLGFALMEVRDRLFRQG